MSLIYRDVSLTVAVRWLLVISDKKKKKKSSIKGAKTPFLFFSTEIRPKIVEENKGIAFGEIGKKIGQLYVPLYLLQSRSA